MIKKASREESVGAVCEGRVATDTRSMHAPVTVGARPKARYQEPSIVATTP